MLKITKQDLCVLVELIKVMMSKLHKIWMDEGKRHSDQDSSLCHEVLLILANSQVTLQKIVILSFLEFFYNNFLGSRFAAQVQNVWDLGPMSSAQ